jgi:hypothetical protein
MVRATGSGDGGAMSETMQQRRGRLVQEHLAPRMKAAGLRKSGMTWWERRDGGWLVLELRGDRENTKDRVGFWTSVEVWPAGTYEFFLLLYPKAGPPCASGWGETPQLIRF